MMKTKKILIFTLFTFLILFRFDLQTVQAAYLDLNAEAAILVEETTGKVLYTKSETRRMYPASMTKMLTALVTLDHLEPDEMVVTGDEINAVPAGSSMSGHIRGESLLVENLIRGLIIPSGNETACVAAVAVAKKVTESDSMPYAQAEQIFSELMNERALKLGATDSHFVNPHGYHDDNHYTTALDLALIAREAMKNPLMRKIAAEEAFSGNGAGENPEPALRTKTYNWESHNSLIYSKDYRYPYANGIKTGFTDEAGYCLAGSAEKDGKKLISIVFKATETGRWEDTKKLFDFGFSYFRYETVQKKGEALEKVLLSNPKLGESRTLEVLGADEFIDFLSADELNKIKRRVEYDEALLADKKEGDDPEEILLQTPIEKDAVIGKVIYTLEDKTLFEGNVLAAQAVDKRTLRSDFDYYLDQLKKNAFTLKALPFWIGAVGALLAVVLILRMRSRRRNRNFYRLNKRY